MQSKQKGKGKKALIFAVCFFLVLSAAIIFKVFGPDISEIDEYVSSAYLNAQYSLGLINDYGRNDIAVHYLYVGQGDCELVVCEGQAMLIDAGESGNEKKVIDYIHNCGITTLDYVVATHPHEDHIGGLPSVFNAAPVGLVLSPVAEWDSTRFQIIKRYTEAQGTEIYVPLEGDIFELGGATFTIVHCWPEAWAVNDMSIALRLEYGNVSFLFTGDAEQMAEYMMIDSQFLLQSDVLHVSHHGSRSSSIPEFINAVNPRYAVISCSSDGGYGHPHQETLNTLKEHEVELYRTDLQGTVIISSDGSSLSFTTDHMTLMDLFEAPHFDVEQYRSRFEGDQEQETERQVAYIGNRHSMKFHRPDCNSVLATQEKNRVLFYSREEAVSAGYEPCGRCNP